MKAAGEALNLKGHIAGFAKYQTNLCYGPGDIECHLGKVLFIYYDLLITCANKYNRTEDFMFWISLELFRPRQFCQALRKPIIALLDIF